MLRSVETGIASVALRCDQNVDVSLSCNFQENVTISDRSYLQEEPDIDIVIANIQAEIERRNTFGYGLGVFLGRMCDNQTQSEFSCSNNSTQSSFLSNINNFVSNGVSVFEKIKNNILSFCFDLPSNLEPNSILDDVHSIKYLVQSKCDPLFLLTKIIDDNECELLEAWLQSINIDLNELLINDLSPLEYAIVHNHFEIANVLNKYGANLPRRPVIAIATSNERNGAMYQTALESIKILSNEVMGITISPPQIVSAERESELLSELSALQSQLRENESFPQIVMRSDIKEIRKIRHYVENIFKYVDGIWLSGGVNVWKDWYADANSCESPDDLLRDIFEMAILDYQQREKAIPLIGICRGHQLINVYQGGSLKDEGEIHFNPVISLTNNGMLGILAPSISLGWSNHMQSIDRLAPSLEAVMVSQSGMIKAIQTKEQGGMLIGTQFHPEYTVARSEKRLTSDEIRELRQGGKTILFHFVEGAQTQKQGACLATHEIGLSTVLIAKILSLMESSDNSDRKELFTMLEDSESQKIIKERYLLVLETALRQYDLAVVNKIIEIPGMLNIVNDSPDFMEKMKRNDVYIPISIRSMLRY